MDQRNDQRNVDLEGVGDLEIVDACSLEGDDVAVRLAELRALLSQTTERERVGERARFRFAGEHEERLHELTTKEQQCCGFWAFAVEREGPDVVLEVGVTSRRFAGFVDRLFELAG